uniref:Ribonuclease H protein At1g65750 family n=1 Tax=Cajanus cajan TaxID=3821 RepID=A0A151TXD3_CAJCA|nr:Putative ribonuclease H protein At1g65750 family [Cajanus cajan]
MQSVYLPKSICDEVDRLCRNFLWGESSNHKKYHAIGWNKICRPKEAGGLGLRSMRNVNTTYMMKNCWNLIQDPHKLWVQVVRAKYKCKNGIIPQVMKTNKMSNLWKGICASWELIKPHICWRINNGRTASFWYNNWLPNHMPIIHYSSSFIPPVELFKTIHEYTSGQGTWQIDHLQSWLPQNILETIYHFPLPTNGYGQDVVLWSPSKDGVFTTKSAVTIASSSHTVSHPPPFKAIWRWNGPERIRVLLWRVVHGSLMTNQVRVDRGLGTDPTCSVCMQETESNLHALRDCKFAAEIWSRTSGGSLPRSFAEDNIHDWVHANLKE